MPNVWSAQLFPLMGKAVEAVSHATLQIMTTHVLC